MKKLFATALAMMMTLAATAVRVHTLGDSLAEGQPASSVQQGWPTFLQAYFAENSGLTVINPAKSGTSAMTFYKGYWKNKAELNVQPGDYVLIGFAHNDENRGGADIYDYNNYLKQQGKDTLTDMRGSIPSTTYRYWLTKLVQEVQAKGATPVLYSCVCRMYFDKNGKITRKGRHDLGDSFDKCENVNGTWVFTQGNSLPASDHSMDYSYQIKDLAQTLGVAFVDLTTASKNVFESYGETNTKAVLGVPSDGTHTSAVGANLMAREMAKMLRDSIPFFADKVVVNSAVSANPSDITVGECYTEVDMINKILVQGFEMGAGGSISVSAGNNLTVSFDGVNYAKTLTKNWVGETLMQNIYVCANYISTGAHSDNITVTVGSVVLTIPVTANAISLEGGTEAIIEWPLQSDTHADAEGGLVAAFEYPGLKINQYKMLDTVRYDHYLARFRPTGDTWPAGEIDQVDGRYVGFSVTAPADKEVLIEDISFVVGSAATNSIRYRARYSKDASFGENTVLCENLAMRSNTEDTVSLQPVIRLEAGETVYFRFFPWASEALTSKYFCMRNMRIRAQVFGGEPEIEVEPGYYTAGFSLPIANIATEFDTLRSNLPEGFVVTRTTTAGDNWKDKDVYHCSPDSLLPVKAYRNGSDGKYDENTTHFGFTVQIPEGKYLLIDSISADWAYQKNAASYKFIVTKLGVDFYESPEHNMAGPKGGSAMDYTVSTMNQALLQKLTGTVEIKMPFWIKSSAAYVSLLKFQIHARVGHDAEPSAVEEKECIMHSAKCIVNGRLVIRRGDKTYDLFGHRL